MFAVLVGLCSPIATVSPKPVKYTTEDRTYFLSGADFSCEVGGSAESCLGLVQNAIDFYKQAIFPLGEPKYSGSNALHTISIRMETAELPRDFRTNNETYSVRVNESGIFLHANNSFGVARALATLS